MRRAASLPVVMKSLADELESTITRGDGLRFSVPPNGKLQYYNNYFYDVFINLINFDNTEQVIGEGFVGNFSNPPLFSLSVRTHPSKNTALLYSGVPPREFAINR